MVVKVLVKVVEASFEGNLRKKLMRNSVKITRKLEKIYLFSLEFFVIFFELFFQGSVFFQPR